MKAFPGIVALIIFSAALASPAQGAAKPAAPLKGPQPSYEEFDQTKDGGWRALQREGKYLEAARLIDSYESSKADLGGSERINLRFHAGQMYAFAGDPAQALKRLREAKYPPEIIAQMGEDKAYLESWNYYVDATVAFLERDRAKLLKCRELMAGTAQAGVLPQNIEKVDDLLRDFGESYLVAYAGKRPARPASEVTVKLGEVADCGRGMAIRFEDVLEDSRCPVGATCVWVGNGKVALSVERTGESPVKIELNTTLEPKSAKVSNTTVELADLTPTRKVGETLDKRLYVVTLKLKSDQP